MECPFCAKIESDVIDSRLTPEKNAIRRRRRCSACAGRFTTYESTPEHFLFLLMKQHVAKGASLKRPETLFAFMTSAFKGLSEGVERLVEKVDEIEKARAEIKAKKKLVAKAAIKAKPKKKVKAKPAVKAKPKKKVKAKPAVKAKPKKKVRAKPAVKAKPKKKVRAMPAVKAKPKKKVRAMPAVKVKAKKRAPVRKKIVVPKAKEVKRTRKVSATEEVLQIIRRHKKGVDITKLKNQTGFADSKLRMIVSRAYKQGKIKRIARGVYATA